MNQRASSVKAFILHAIPYQENSAIFQLLSLQFGRFSVIAKGIKSKRSQARKAIMQPFNELQVEYAGTSELKTLVQCEPCSFDYVTKPFFQGESLACAYYANELLMRALPVNQAYDDLYLAYGYFLDQLTVKPNFLYLLRQFEIVLLKSLGIAPDFTYDIDGKAIQSSCSYVYFPERGFSPVLDGPCTEEIPGYVILGLEVMARNFAFHALKHSDFASVSSSLIKSVNDEIVSVHWEECDLSVDEIGLCYARKVTRVLLRETIGIKPLQSRKLWRQLKLNEKK